MSASPPPVLTPSAPRPFTVALDAGVTPDKWVRAWRERMPQHLLEVTREPAPLAALLDGSADLALVRAPTGERLATDDRHAIALYEERAVVVVPEDHAATAYEELALADLAGETVVNDVALVAAGVGIAIMPQAVARSLSRRDTAVRPLTDAATTTVHLVWLADSGGELVDAFVGIVRGRTARSSR